MTRLRVPAALAAALLLPLSASAQNGATSPTLEDLFQHQSLGNAQLAPDGSAVLYTVSTPDLEENESDSDIWYVRANGGEPVRLTTNPRNDTRPRWRPDGARFAFVSARGTGDDARPALYLMSPTGGEPELLYRHDTPIGAFEWSSDGRFIAFSAREEETQEQKDADESGRDVEIEDGPDTHSHLWLLDVAEKEARRLTGRDSATVFTVGGFAWNPSAQQIAFAATPTPNPVMSWQSDLYVIATDDTTAAPVKLTDNPGPDTGPTYSHDGRWIYYEGFHTDAYRVGQSRLFRMASNGGAAQDVTPGDLDAGGVTPTADGVWFSAVTGTTTGLFFMPHDGSTHLRVTSEDGVYGNFTLSADGSRVAYTFESPTQPAELHVASLAPRGTAIRDARALTQHNADMKQYAVGRTEVLRWQSTDGREVEGVVVYPKDYRAGQRVPLVVKIHGGPSGVYLQNFQAAGYGNNAQWYAADGYAMLLPNPRGSSGYGDEAQRSVIGDWGGLDFQDIMTGVDALIEQGVAHPDSLGVMGWSYGGYMTAWTVTQTDRFKAAVNGAGITEPISMWGTQDIIHVFEGYFGGSPFEDGRWDVYQQSSPMAHVRNATTPTLMIHGRNDPRVPPNQAQIFYRALRALGVPSELVWLPRTGHGPSEPGLQYETALRQKQWMDRWIRGQASGKPIT
jgi:dipeptidyl aminopeptidase/acylaminoacyl peptidase